MDDILMMVWCGCTEERRRKREAEKKRVGRVRERAETLLSSMLALLNQLADAARILNSPLSSSLLVIPLNDEDQETNAAWSSAENIVKSLKVGCSSALHCLPLNSLCMHLSLPVLIRVFGHLHPLWTRHNHAEECQSQFSSLPSSLEDCLSVCFGGALGCQ